MLQGQLISLMEQRLRRQELPLAVALWNGNGLQLSPEPRVRLVVRRPRALRHLINPSLGGLARSYVEQDIDLEGDARDILAVGEILCSKDANDIADNSGTRSTLRWWRHSRPYDRKAISYHYDVSNEFYGLWLDSRRVYSCGYFRRPEDSLDTAQEQKLDHICRKLALKRGESFLDIGCGWGGLILWAAERYGVRATGITLSQNQFEHVQAQIRARGLEACCEVRLQDYRDLAEDQPFDKIASVGMFEHVGKRNLGVYFGKIMRLLKPGGLVMNHGITSTGVDRVGLGSEISQFVDRYVFPGGELVHVSKVVESMSREGLECWDAECLRPHYAKTLWHWVHNLETHADAARALVGEERFRIWRIYMAGSAHAFERGWLSIFQILAGRPLPDGRLPYPLTREHVYALGAGAKIGPAGA